MHSVRVFLTHHYDIPKLEERLSKHGIPLHREKADCDVAFVLHGGFTNPLIFDGKRVLAFFLKNDNHLWNTCFVSLYMPILKHYYDEFIDLGGAKTFSEMADKIAVEVKRLENATD